MAPKKAEPASSASAAASPGADMFTDASQDTENVKMDDLPQNTDVAGTMRNCTIRAGCNGRSNVVHCTARLVVCCAVPLLSEPGVPVSRCYASVFHRGRETENGLPAREAEEQV
jgi:hypothetical protein